MPAPEQSLNLYRSLTAGYEFVQFDAMLLERKIVLDDQQTRIIERGEWTVLPLTREQVRQNRDRADATAQDNATIYYWRALDACAWSAQRSTYKVQPAEQDAQRQLDMAQERLQALTANSRREFDMLAQAVRTPEALPTRTPELPERRDA